MVRATKFVQDCPVCGRKVQVRIDLLGKDVTCQHCSGRFSAADPENPSLPIAGGEWNIMSRVAELLALSEPDSSRWHVEV